MSYQTWHIYGYGICVSDITRCTVERLEKLLALAPNYQKRMHQWFMDCKITKPNLKDYLNYDQNFNLGLATILKDVILETDGIELVACDSYDSTHYLLYCPTYPWHRAERKLVETEDDVRSLFHKCIAVLTDEIIDIDYQAVENGG